MYPDKPGFNTSKLILFTWNITHIRLDRNNSNKTAKNGWEGKCILNKGKNMEKHVHNSWDGKCILNKGKDKEEPAHHHSSKVSP